MSQHDIGFNTGLKKWFIQSMTGNRSMIVGQTHVDESDITINNVMCNTTAWGDPNNPQISHGRLTYYEGNQQDTKQTGNLADSIEVTGSNKHFKFTKFQDVKSVLKYDIQNAVWSIQIEDNTFVTKRICGLITGKCFKNHVWFDIEPSTIYFNTFITLYNPEL